MTTTPSDTTTADLPQQVGSHQTWWQSIPVAFPLAVKKGDRVVINWPNRNKVPQIRLATGAELHDPELHDPDDLVMFEIPRDALITTIDIGPGNNDDRCGPGREAMINTVTEALKVELRRNDPQQPHDIRALAVAAITAQGTTFVGEPRPVPLLEELLEWAPLHGQALIPEAELAELRRTARFATAIRDAPLPIGETAGSGPEEFVMDGRELYAAYCDVLHAGWNTSPAEGLFVVNRRPAAQPTRAPVDFAFLTPLEQDAWNVIALAAVQQIGVDDIMAARQQIKAMETDDPILQAELDETAEAIARTEAEPVLVGKDLQERRALAMAAMAAQHLGHCTCAYGRHWKCPIPGHQAGPTS